VAKGGVFEVHGHPASSVFKSRVRRQAKQRFHLAGGSHYLVDIDLVNGRV
jgi:hypothetical protein